MSWRACATAGWLRSATRPMVQVIQRHAVRAILLTPEEEVLLLRVRDPGGEHSWWITPGGGREAGETLEQTLRRELDEELGLRPGAIGPLVWRRQHTVTMHARRWCQYEDYFLIPTPRFTPVMRDADEASRVLEMRWWPLAELFSTDQDLTPRAIATIVEDYLRDGPPQGELEIEVLVD